MYKVFSVLQGNFVKLHLRSIETLSTLEKQELAQCLLDIEVRSTSTEGELQHQRFELMNAVRSKSISPTK